MIEPFGAPIYRAAEGFEAELADELGDAEPIGGTFFRSPGPVREAAWAVDTWLDPSRIRFESLGGASMALLSLGKKWTLSPFTLFDRAELIRKQLPANPQAPLHFPSAPPELGGEWTLASRNEILAATKHASPFPRGVPVFQEDRGGPPSRAYLKLWEALTRLGVHPREGDRAVDLGSSPGGWTWALHELGAHVVSVDKARLSLPKSERIEFRQESAFGIEPKSIAKVDWLVSDVICYPAKLVTMILRWLDAHPRARFVVTVKFQGKTDMAPLSPLRAIAGSKLLHLHHNRHELTWML